MGCIEILRMLNATEIGLLVRCVGCLIKKFPLLKFRKKTIPKRQINCDCGLRKRVGLC